MKGIASLAASLAFVVLVLGCNRGASRPGDAPATTAAPVATPAPFATGVPKPVDLTGAIEKYFGVKCASAEALCPALAPIGFSRKGAFAFATEPPDEACGCWFHRVVIQDLKTDAIAWEEKGNTPLAGGDRGPTSLAELWAAKPEIAAKLAEHGLLAAGDLALRPFPAGDVGVHVTKDGAEHPDYGVHVVNRLKVELTSPKGRKTILDRTIDNSAFPTVLDAQVLGWIENPHEKRIAVVLAVMGRGYEGPPNPIRIEIAGADLATGFR